MDRLKACYKLHERGFGPHTPFAHFGRQMEILSYPFPNARGGISILVRELSNPFTIREVGILENEYFRRPECGHEVGAQAVVRKDTRGEGISEP
ncbi:MAG: hypothetical protein KGM47_14060 [Acidobacteriota bacterium]|nr:hypothetical protein [Acidobacteriota bacterium]